MGQGPGPPEGGVSRSRLRTHFDPMNFIVDRTSDTSASLRVEVPADTVAQERKGIVAAFASQANIPGFRKGKIPGGVIEKRYAKQITEELQGRLVNKGIQDGIKKEELDVLRVLDVEEPELHDDSTFTFVAQLMLTPSFELPEYKGIPISVPKVEVTDDDIELQLDSIRQRFAEYNDVDRAAEMGDIAVIDYTGSVDGTPLEEVSEQVGYLANGQNQPIRLSEGAFLPGFVEELAGLAKDDEKEFSISLDENFGIEELKEKDIDYKVKVNFVQEQVLPELTDELAGQIEEDLTLEKLKERAEEDLLAQQTNARQEEMTTQVLQFLDEQIQMELPEAIVQGETQRQVNDIVYRSQMQGMDQDKLQEQQEEIFDYAAKQAEVNVKTGFILEQIAEKEGIKAEEPEILSMVAQMAQSQNKPIKKMIKELQKDEQIPNIANRIRTSKTLDFLRENAEVTDVERPVEDQ